MDGKQILGFLKELVKFRQKEFDQMVAARCNPKPLDSYSNRTAELIKLVQDYSQIAAGNEFEFKEMSIDEAILHCKEIASKSCDNCAKQHLQLANWLEELKQKKDYETQMKQLVADWDNARKRMVKEREEIVANANEKLLSQLLDVADSLQLAVESFSRKDKLEDVGKGLEIVQKQLEQVLEKNGCKKIDCNIGDKFDVNLHDATATANDILSGYEPDRILHIAKDGYMLNGKLLRPAKVVVAQ